MDISLKLMLTSCCIVLFLSCNNLKESKGTADIKQNESNAIDLDSSYMITKDTFNVWKNRWDDNYRSYFAKDSLHYFTMPLFDMNAIIGEDGTGSRLYMGMAIESNGSFRPHVMLVGVSNDTVNWNRIMDYTNSCPPICGD